MTRGLHGRNRSRSKDRPRQASACHLQRESARRQTSDTATAMAAFASTLVCIADRLHQLRPSLQPRTMMLSRRVK